MDALSLNEVFDLQIPSKSIVAPYYAGKDLENTCYYEFATNLSHKYSIFSSSYWFSPVAWIEIDVQLPNKAINDMFIINRRIIEEIKLYTVFDLINKLESSGCKLKIRVHYKSFRDRLLGASGCCTCCGENPTYLYETQ